MVAPSSHEGTASNRRSSGTQPLRQQDTQFSEIVEATDAQRQQRSLHGTRSFV
jgi:hypothetical protein